jgi:transcriptional regulator ATRX
VPYRLDGSTPSSERQNLVERFNDPANTRVKCTLISTRAGSLGINLHAANRVVLLDGSWNPTHDLQAIYRVWRSELVASFIQHLYFYVIIFLFDYIFISRYGQVKPVYAYRLMAHGTMEEKIYKRQVSLHLPSWFGVLSLN